METTALLNSITDKQETLLETVIDWANTNSGSFNLEGVENVRQKIKSYCKKLNAELSDVHFEEGTLIDKMGQSSQLSVGKGLRIKKRPDAPFQILFSGHIDTVYPKNSTFQECKLIEQNKLIGPGVTDMKSGLVILLNAIESFENSDHANDIGWEILLTPDEEIGSVSSQHLLMESAKRHDIGLVFESTLPDGTFISERKSSANFVVTSEGKKRPCRQGF